MNNENPTPLAAVIAEGATLYDLGRQYECALHERDQKTKDRIHKEARAILTSPSAAAEQVEKLAEENRQLKAKNEGLVEHLTLATNDLEAMRIDKFKGFGRYECWMWQGDGNDKLETLVCPVVIWPNDLQAIIDKATPTAPPGVPDEVREAAKRWNAWKKGLSVSREGYSNYESDKSVLAIYAAARLAGEGGGQ